MSLEKYPKTKEEAEIKINQILEEIGKSVGKGIDELVFGTDNFKVLFEADFLWSTSKENANEITIGQGLGAKYPSLFKKLIQVVTSKGEIISTEQDSTNDFLIGETDASRYFNTAFPNTEFPVDRTSYEFIPSFGGGLFIQLDKFYWADKDDTKTPLMVQLTARKDFSIDIFSKLDNSKTRVPVLA